MHKCLSCSLSFLSAGLSFCDGHTFSQQLLHILSSFFSFCSAICRPVSLQGYLRQQQLILCTSSVRRDSLNSSSPLAVPLCLPELHSECQCTASNSDTFSSVSVLPSGPLESVYWWPLLFAIRRSSSRRTHFNLSHFH